MKNWGEILASNDLSLNPGTMLDNYKNQNAVEKGFRFLKDKIFRSSEVYLKKTFGKTGYIN